MHDKVSPTYMYVWLEMEWINIPYWYKKGALTRYED